ncbi:hypothetical protein ACOMHN_042561 [Nucella lapillus]
MRNVEVVGSSHAILNSTSVPGSSPRLRISLDSKNLQQLLKEELRLSILSKRHGARNRSQAAKMDCADPLIHEMNGVDVERRERRREQNRRAAQRCRRKKRMDQVSVLQNYEWIISRNTHLQQEVNHLRQEMTRLNSVLKAHRNACTCPHVHKGPLHVQTANVKVEPGEESPGPKTEYTTPPVPRPSAPTFRCQALSSCQYEAPVSGRSLVSDRNSSALSQDYERSIVRMNNQQAFYANTIQERNPSYQSPMQTVPQQSQPCVSPSSQQVVPHASPTTGLPIPSPSCSMNYHQPGEGEHQHMNSLIHHYNVPDMQENPFNMQLTARDHESVPEEFNTSVPIAAFGPAPVNGSSRHHLGGPHPAGPFAVLENLTGGGMGSCLFEAATPLSADGRCSISSVSSDTSGGTDPASHDVVFGTKNSPRFPVAEFYVAEEVPTHDLSQLLAQINQSDLIFQQEGGMEVEEGFSDQVVGVASLPQHFLHSL